MMEFETTFDDYDPRLPRPGDYIKNLVYRRAWEAENHRGHNGLVIKLDDQGLVIATRPAHNTENTFRLLLFIKGTFALVSVYVPTVHMNWQILFRPLSSDPRMAYP